MKNRIGIGIITFGIITLALVSLLPRYQPKQRDVLYHQIDSLNTEVEILRDSNLRMQMEIRFKL